jgi:hypothetical protein
LVKVFDFFSQAKEAKSAVSTHQQGGSGENFSCKWHDDPAPHPFPRCQETKTKCRKQVLGRLIIQ